MNKFWFTITLVVLFFSFGKAHSKKLKVLIITGQNNHNWELTSQTVKTIYDTSKLFETTLIKTPAEGEDMSSFKPNFDGYDLICLDYNGDYWPKETELKFEEFVSKGGGLVVYHATDNSFPKWQAFNEMIGVGGWNGRNEKDGPILVWKKGEIVKDTSKGRGGAHGKPQKQRIHIRNKKHPITKGMPEVWLHTKDELYHSLRGPAENIKV